MSARQDVFTYLERSPDASLKEVLDTFSSLKESTIRRYYFEFQKIEKKVEPAKKEKATPTKKNVKAKKESPPKKVAKKTIKQQVYDFMQSAPDTKLRDLAKVFPKTQKTTIGNYRRQWLKENGKPKLPLSKTKKSEIFSFLDNNPDSNINDLKKVFPDVANKLVTVFRSWKNSQAVDAKVKKEKSPKSTKAPTTRKSIPKEITKTAQTWLEKHKDTIARQKEIIDKQRTRIEVLKAQLPNVKKKGIVSSIKKFITDKLSKN